MGLIQTLGIETVAADRTRVEMTMPITDAVLQPFGVLHGGATISLLETAASYGAELSTNLATHRNFGVDVHVRHRKNGAGSVLRGVAELDHEETSAYSGAVKQFWAVTAYDDAGDVVSEGTIVVKIVSLEYLARKAAEHAGS